MPPSKANIAELLLDVGAAMDHGIPLTPSVPIIQSITEAGEMVLKARKAHPKRSTLKTKGRYAPVWAILEARAKPT